MSETLEQIALRVAEEQGMRLFYGRSADLIEFACRLVAALGAQEPVAFKDRTYGNLHHRSFGDKTAAPLYSAPQLPQRDTTAQLALETATLLLNKVTAERDAAVARRDDICQSLQREEVERRENSLLVKLEQVEAERDDYKHALQLITVDHGDEWNRQTARGILAKNSPEDDIEQARRMIG